MCMYALQKYSESDNIGLRLSLVTYQTCDTKALSITANGKIITVMSLHYVSRKRNSDLLLGTLLLVRRPPLKTTLLVKWDLVSILLVLNGNFCCNKNKLKYMFVKDACDTKINTFKLMQAFSRYLIFCLIPQHNYAETITYWQIIRGRGGINWAYMCNRTRPNSVGVQPEL